ncbi:MAG: thiol peroxidase [Tissierellia bacterium]|nr:thiol peroxidase [Tissierellia bacterium]
MNKRTDFKFGEENITLLGDEIKVGDKAPEFKAVKKDLSTFDLNELDGKIKIISVVPSVDTSVCEIQTTKFNQAASDILEDVKIITISNDLPFALDRFCSAKGIDQVETVSDYKDLDFGMKYGVVMEEFRLLNRAVFVIDRDNTVKYVEYVHQNTNLPEYEKAIEAAKELV